MGVWWYFTVDTAKIGYEIYGTLWLPIVIDGLPIKNGGSFHGKLLVITRW